MNGLAETNVLCNGGKKTPRANARIWQQTTAGHGAREIKELYNQTDSSDPRLVYNHGGD
jgi:hypothetical protein